MIKGLDIYRGKAVGETLFIKEPLSFYGGVDPETGIIIQKNHPNHGSSIKNKIIILKNSTGSTVGTWTILRMKGEGTAPLGIITQQSDTVLATGTIVSEIPHIDGIEISKLENVKRLTMDGDVIYTPDELPNSNYHQSHDGKSSPISCDGGIVIKLGGSLITHKESTYPHLDKETLNSISETISNSRRPMALVHGAGSFGHAFVIKHNLLNNPQTPQNLQLWGELQNLQYELNNRVCESLRNNKIPAWPVQPSAIPLLDTPKGEVHLSILLRSLVSKGFVPVLYGTPALSSSGSMYILSGDKLVIMAAKALGYKKILHLTNVEGIFESFKSGKGVGKPIDVITPLTYKKLNIRLNHNSESDVTGSMGSKIELLLQATRDGISSQIINGRIQSTIKSALNDKFVGTIINPT
jgi:isopentenyl phosphate kinase/predicted aconitase with swiveling domain